MKDMNHRMVFVMRLLDIGREDINLFCNFISKGMNESTYNNIITHSSTKSIFESLCKRAIEKEKNSIKNMKNPF